MSLRFILPLVLSVSLVSTVQAAPRINEMVAAGQSSLKDEDNATPDWLEIFNPDATAANLGGWHLSDRAGQTSRWTFPVVTVPPGGYLLVFASGKNRKPLTGRLHTNFGIDSSGGALFLSRPDGTVAQTFSYPAQMPDIAWDGAKFLSNPTPGAQNDPTEEPVTQAPGFNQPRGFHTAPFTLALTSGTQGAAIYYTLNGSEPGTGSARYTAPIRIDKTTVIRAVAISPGNDASPFAARTFIFPADIVKQSPGGRAPKGWPATWGGNNVDYGMDPDITERPLYSRTLKNDLRAVPSFSVVMELADLFEGGSGIYANPFNKGREWERPMSLEYIEPTGGGGFQIGAGIRIRGGASRDTGNAKHSFQFRFRKEYGASHLDFPLFDTDGPARSDAFDLRWDHLVSWHYSNEPGANQLQDIFARDSQLAASGVAKRGNLTNLYLNGQYWGLFYIDERVNSDFGANHFGGAPEDYDVIRYDAESGQTGLNDGNRRAWREAFDLGKAGFSDNARYFRALGRNPDGSRNPGFEQLIDEENLIDYMLVGTWCAATDNPVVGGTDNNWTSIRSRKGDFGFRFFVHDFELSMFQVDEDVVGANPAENVLETREADLINPWHFWMAMRMNAEFRMKVADRVQKHFFNGGALTAEACIARWNARMQEMDRAIVAESARWGDGEGGGFIGPLFDKGVLPGRPEPKPGPGGDPNRRAYTRADWLQGATVKRDEFIALRSEKMLEHLKSALLFPLINAPQIAESAGTVELLNPFGTGTIRFTLNGPDPRLVGGGVHPEALTAGAAFSVARKTTIRARVLDGETWSAMLEKEITPGVDFTGLRITEIQYNPAVTGAETADDGEFIELKNTGTTALNLGGSTFSGGITFTFPANTMLNPGAFFVIARNAAVFEQKHPGVTPNGIFTGKLSDDGESLVLTTAGGARIFALDYDDESPWPFAPDGFGPSLVYDGKGNPDDGKNWRASAATGGSPGADDPAAAFLPRVVVNEVLGQTSVGGETPFIELHNPTTVAADISNWRLGTDRAFPDAKIFDPGTIIPAGGYLVFRPATGMPTLDSAGGTVFLYSVPGGYAHECRYGPAEANVAFGRHINGDREPRFVAMSPTPGAGNSAPMERSPLRISEVFYAWAGNADLDFVEIENTATVPASLAGKRVVGLNYTFPQNTTLGAGERIVVTKATEAAFRAAFSTQTAVVLGPTTGDLQDNGERVALEEPIAGSNPVAWRALDEVRYNDRFPWPVGAAGAGDSLHRLPVPYGDESAAWAVGIPTPGAKGVDGSPRVSMTQPSDQLVVTSGTLLRLSAAATDVDGVIASVEFFVDGRPLEGVTSAPYSVEWIAQPGTHDLSARATDELGNFSDSKPVTIFVKGNESKDGGNGLKAEYFPNETLDGTPVEAVAETIDFDWTERPPAAGIPRRGFSARFSGKLLPREPGFHSLIFRHSGGLRVWLKGEQIIDKWEEPELPSGEFAFSEGGADLARGEPVDLVVEYFDENAHGYLKMIWFEPNNFNEKLVPQSQLYLPDQSVTAFGISTASRIPNRRFGQRVKVSLETTRGVAPVTWSIVDGSLPNGVTINAAGSLNGTASEGGAFTFRLQAEDASGATVQRTFSMLVTSPAGQTNGPIVKFTQPSPGANIESRTVTIAGTFSGGADPLSLEYSLNEGLRHPIQPSRNWSVALDSIRGLLAGENTVQLYATDMNGREASSQVLKFKLRFKSPLNVSIDGSGSVSPGFLGTTIRFVGDQFSVTAKPAPGWIFSHWDPSFNTTPTLIAKMEEDMNLTAVFVKNPFPPFAGKYTGLIGENRRQGRYDLSISNNGAFTMALFIGGARMPISGRLTPAGTFDTYQESGGSLPYYVGLILRFDTSEVALSTQFYNFDFFEAYESIALRANWLSKCPAAGAWTLQLSSPSEDFPGSGYATMRIGKDGRATLSGKTSDGMPINAGLRVAEDLSIPFYTPVSNGGTLVGAMSYISQRGRRINGGLRWFSDSIDQQTSVEGAPFTPPPAGKPVFLLQNGEGIFIHRAPTPTFFTGAILSSANKFVFSTPGTAAPVLVVDPTNGLVTGSYLHPETRKREKLRGVVNQLTSTASGIIMGESPGGFTVGPRGR